MALNSALIDQHIAAWEGTLRGSFYPYREKWPSRLFHHAPMENAASILNSGSLLSRNASQATRVLDVAEPGVLANRVDAHAFARLYFRPRTPTQYKIEGVCRPGERLGTAHSPTLAMFIFDAKSILSTNGVQFSNANMQAGATTCGDDAAFFGSIDFSRVYHEGSFSAEERNAIIPRRCAEVLVPSPLALDGPLQWVFCRSQGERTYLRHLLNEEGRKWLPRILVSDDIRVFFKRFSYVESVDLADDGLVIGLAPRQDGGTVSVEAVVTNSDTGQVVINFGPQDLQPFPPHERQRWRIVGALPAGQYDVVVKLHGCVAFAAQLFHEEIPF